MLKINICQLLNTTNVYVKTNKKPGGAIPAF